MKRQYISLFAMALGAMLFASCQKDNINVLRLKAEDFIDVDGTPAFCLGEKDAPYNENVVTLTEDARALYGTKVYIDNSGYACWSDDCSDKININGTVYGVGESKVRQAHVELESDNELYGAYPGENAVYGSNSFTYTLPSVQTYEEDGAGNQVVKAPMQGYVTSSKKIMDMYNLCSLMCIKTTGSSKDTPSDVKIRSISITARDADDQPVALCGTSNAVGYNSDHTPKALSIESNKGYRVTLDCGTGVMRSDHTFYVVLPPVGENIRFTLTFFYENGTIKNTAVKTTSKAKLGASEMGVVRPNLPVYNSAAEGRLPGKFTIGTNVTARFACGNLRYTRTGGHETSYGLATSMTNNGTWTLASQQYTVLGNVTANAGGPTVDYTGNDTMDLFGWGTSGWTSGATCYQPWQHHYGPAENNQYYLGGDASKSMSGNFEYADWGVSNAISNGGNAPFGWRTLTSDEWNYLATHASVTTATVNGVAGVLLFPDNWSTDFSSMSGMVSSSISAANFARLENSGVVFLPNAAIAEGPAGGTILSYWSSTVSGDNVMVFKGTATCTAERRSAGRAVRLVTANN